MSHIDLTVIFKYIKKMLVTLTWTSTTVNLLNTHQAICDLKLKSKLRNGKSEVPW